MRSQNRDLYIGKTRQEIYTLLVLRQSHLSVILMIFFKCILRTVISLYNRPILMVLIEMHSKDFYVSLYNMVVYICGLHVFIYVDYIYILRTIMCHFTICQRHTCEFLLQMDQKEVLHFMQLQHFQINLNL